AVMAIALPWLWLLSLEDTRLAHVRLGIFGFGGLAVSGYLLTAMRAWIGRDVPVPALALGFLALGARVAALCAPEMIWPVLLPSLVIASAILWPVLQARRWDKLLLAMIPLAMTAAEAALVQLRVTAAGLPIAMAAVIFAVGGRMVPAFLAEDRRRCKLKAQPEPAHWPGLATLGVGLVLEGAAGAVALMAVPLWVMHSVRGGLRSRPASRMLCLGYAGLVPGLLGLPAARAGLIPPHVEAHLLTMAAMGPMVLAVAARVAMRRSAGAELLPCRRHWGALWLVFSAAAVRGIAELAPQPELWMTLAGIGWSAAWILFLSAHLAALAQPAPFPLLSAARMPQAIS
ncbi:MAG: NnrS family protein, partial [Achromobacter sp.]|uniref:NnrS family protein n=1 Tax=Achromobacter sp. TaxID=134375 RepID=UPI002587E2E2